MLYEVITFINIMKNEEGEIIMISANPASINSITRNIMENAKLKLEKIGNA